MCIYDRVCFFGFGGMGEADRLNILIRTFSPCGIPPPFNFCMYMSPYDSSFFLCVSSAALKTEAAAMLSDLGLKEEIHLWCIVPGKLCGLRHRG